MTSKSKTRVFGFWGELRLIIWGWFLDWSYEVLPEGAVDGHVLDLYSELTKAVSNACDESEAMVRDQCGE